MIGEQEGLAREVQQAVLVADVFCRRSYLVDLWMTLYPSPAHHHPPRILTKTTTTTTTTTPNRATDGTICKMQIWDTAGQERFRAMAPLYYRNAAVAVVCFDIMDEESFQKMKDWVEELRTNVPEGKLVLAIACTKVCLYTQACSVFQRFIGLGGVRVGAWCFWSTILFWASIPLARLSCPSSRPCSTCTTRRTTGRPNPRRP